MTESIEEDENSFYPTYEALKPVLKLVFAENRKWFLPYLWGIETLLPFWSHFFPFTSFYPTYEALKRSLTNPNEFQASKFLPYLWGIETPESVIHFR